jgi:hypothetical protein
MGCYKTCHSGNGFARDEDYMNEMGSFWYFTKKRTGRIKFPSQTQTNLILPYIRVKVTTQVEV